MNTLLELNAFSDGVFSYTDNRPSGVRFDYPTARDIQKEITTTSFTLERTIDIVEIIQPAIANVKFKIDLSNIPEGATLSWTSLPSGVTVTQVLGVYTVSGIQSAAIWDAIKAPTITLNGETFGSFAYICTIEYTENGTRLEKQWEVGNYKALATLAATSACSATCNVIRGFSGDLIAITEVFFQGEFLIIGRFTLDCNPFTVWDGQAAITANTQLESNRYLEFDVISNISGGPGSSYYGEHLALDNYQLFYSDYTNNRDFTVAPVDGTSESAYRDNSTRVSSMALTPKFIAYLGEDTDLYIYNRVYYIDDYYGLSSSLWYNTDPNNTYDFHIKALAMIDTDGDIINDGEEDDYGGDARLVMISNDQTKVYVFETDYASGIGNHLDLIYEKTVSGESSFNLTTANMTYFVASTDDSNEIYVWNMSDGSLARTITTTYSNPSAIKLHGSNLVVAHTSGTEVYDISDDGDGELLTTLHAGNACDINEKYVIIGSKVDEEAYVYLINSRTNYQLWKTLTNPNINTASSNDEFGTAVAITTERAVVSAPYEDDDAYNPADPNRNAGAIYIYEG